MTDTTKMVIALSAIGSITLALLVLGYFKTGMNLGAVLNNLG